MVANEKKIKPESATFYRVNMWTYKVVGLFWNPQRRLKDIPLKEGIIRNGD